MRDTGFAWNGGPVNEEVNNTNKSTMKSCCKSQASSVEDDFPNRADIKPILRKQIFGICHICRAEVSFHLIKLSGPSFSTLSKG